MPTPEFLARQQIDSLLIASGWVIQDRAAMNLYASRGVAVREFPVEGGFADYMLFADRKAVGVVERRQESTKAVQAVVDAALRSGARLRKAILGSVFTGSYIDFI